MKTAPRLFYPLAARAATATYYRHRNSFIGNSPAVLPDPNPAFAIWMRRFFRASFFAAGGTLLGSALGALLALAIAPAIGWIPAFFPAFILCFIVIRLSWRLI